MRKSRFNDEQMVAILCLRFASRSRIRLQVARERHLSANDNHR